MHLKYYDGLTGNSNLIEEYNKFIANVEKFKYVIKKRCCYL